MSESWSESVVLEGRHVRLEPLRLYHAPALAEAADDPDLFRWTSAPITDTADAEEFIAAALDDTQRVPFAQIDVHTDAVVGTTSYYALAPRLHCLAIGYTWLSRTAQGTAINPESKYLLMKRAFEDLGAVRVEWHTDELNTQSRAAIAKLGARFEGLLRKHRQRRDGSWRTTALFAMTDDDWPAARQQLEQRIG